MIYVTSWLTSYFWKYVNAGMSQQQGLNFINQLASSVISQQLATACSLFLYCSSYQSLLLFNSKLCFNTSLFTFYITLSINIAIQFYAWLQQKHRFIIPGIRISIWQNAASITGAHYCPDYYPHPWPQQCFHNWSDQG